MGWQFWRRRPNVKVVKDTSPRHIYTNMKPPSYGSTSAASSPSSQKPHEQQHDGAPPPPPNRMSTISTFTTQLQKTDSTSLLLLNSSSQANLLSSINPESSSSVPVFNERRASSFAGGRRRFSTTPNPHREFTKHYNTNEVSTSKYTLWTFLPKNLYEQFRSVANFYFLVIAILQAFPTFAIVSFGLVIVPLIIILGFTGLKDAVEDWRRHVADRRVNETNCYLLRLV
jgi:hypothetical protein